MNRFVLIGIVLALFAGACGTTAETTTTVGVDGSDSVSDGSGNAGEDGATADSSTTTGAESATTAVREQFDDLGQDHLSDAEVAAVLAGDDLNLAYNSVPPTSGPHAAIWAPCGIYEQTLPYVYQIHSLEHGAVVINHPSEIDPADVATLRDFAREKGSHIIVSPNDDLASYVVLTAWTVKMELDVVDLGAIGAFWADYANEGPERIACPIEIDEAA